MDVSVITVTWNSAEFIAAQLASVAPAVSKLMFEQLVVDNASKDTTVSVVTTDFPKVRVLQNAVNVGFAAANNQALTLSKGEFILFLNPDMQLAPESIATLVSFMREHPICAVAAPLLTNAVGAINTETLPRRFPTFGVLMLQLFKLPHLFPSFLNTYQYYGTDFTKNTKVDSVRGSCMLVRRSFLEQLGFAFDPRYFLWFEDVDLCREAKRHGYEVWHVPEATARDYVGQSFKKSNHSARQKQFFTSSVVYFKKWEPGIKPLIVQILSPIGILLVRMYSWFKY